MYRRPKFLELLLEIRETMSREAGFEVGTFAAQFLSDQSPNITKNSVKSPRRAVKNHPIKNKIQIKQKIEYKIGREDD